MKLVVLNIKAFSCTFVLVHVSLQSCICFHSFQIRPFREAHKNRHKDKELLKLAKYLKKIAALEDFSSLNHKYWERSVLLLVSFIW